MTLSTQNIEKKKKDQLPVVVFDVRDVNWRFHFLKSPYDPTILTLGYKSGVDQSVTRRGNLLTPTFRWLAA